MRNTHWDLVGKLCRAAHRSFRIVPYPLPTARKQGWATGGILSIPIFIDRVCLFAQSDLFKHRGMDEEDYLGSYVSHRILCW